SAASRVYIPEPPWPELRELIVPDVKSCKIGPTDDVSNFSNAVIDEQSFDKLAKFIDQAKEDSAAEIIVGGRYDKSEGYYIHPTVIKAGRPDYVTMCEELFGPVLTVYVYEDDKWEEMLEVIDN